MASKRVVIRYTSGLRQIAGLLDLSPQDQCPQTLVGVRVGEWTGNVAFVRAGERHIEYKEICMNESRVTCEMPRFKCHKEVWALKIKNVVKHAHPDPLFNDAMFEASPEFQGAHLFFEDTAYAPIPVDADWYRKHDPSAGGYYVVYKDGYQSFSPADAFESGYTRER